MFEPTSYVSCHRFRWCLKQGPVKRQDFTATHNDLPNVIVQAVILQTQVETTIGFHVKFEIPNEITRHLYQITIYYEKIFTNKPILKQVT